MTDLVDSTLRLWRSQPFQYGGTVPHVPGVGDCMLSIGEYLASCGLTDVTGMFRGRYNDEAGALAQMTAYGGAVGLVDMTGAIRTDAPVRGDVVVIDTGQVDIGTLCTGDRIAARLDRGVVEIPLRFVRVVQSWKVS